MRWCLCIFLLLAAPVWAVQPDEVLDDPVLEERARDISAGLRCPVCQNESIDESSADIARVLRLLVRERLVAGDSDEAVVDYIVARYGEFVLLNPRAQGSTWVLWLAGPALLLGGCGIALAFLRQRSSASEAGMELTAQEQSRLDSLMKD